LQLGDRICTECHKKYGVGRSWTRTRVSAPVVDEDDVEGGGAVFDQTLHHAGVLVSDIEEEIGHVLQLGADLMHVVTRLFRL
jgi:hypothetical protein